MSDVVQQLTDELCIQEGFAPVTIVYDAKTIGAYNIRARQVTINSRLSKNPPMALAVIAHELAHEKRHGQLGRFVRCMAIPLVVTAAALITLGQVFEAPADPGLDRLVHALLTGLAPALVCFAWAHFSFWADEFACDRIGRRMTGNAPAFVEMLEWMSASTGGHTSWRSSHPPDSWRIALARRAARKQLAAPAPACSMDPA